jgi:hypothetical protein
VLISYLITNPHLQTSIFHSLIIAQKQPTRNETNTIAVLPFLSLYDIAEKLAVPSSNGEIRLPEKQASTLS